MKKLITLLLVLVTLNGYSQVVIDNEKIEKLCFEIHNTYRDSSHQREIMEGCKKAADFQVDYLYKNNVVTHKNPTYGYQTQEERFSKFNTETIKLKDYYDNTKYKEYPKYDYDAEIITYCNNHSFKVDSLLEKNISKRIINNFVKSKGHFYGMTLNMYKGKNHYGYFSVRTKIIKYDEEKNLVYLNIYCVGVFGSEGYIPKNSLF
tara:strand:- start:2424 stop:3038 length:615 start_codon:yes stop_codon:yes gene_type:complete